MAKATTVKVRVAVIYNKKGGYQAGGDWLCGKRPLDHHLIGEVKDIACGNAEDLPHACIVEIELPIPEPLKGKVIKVKQVKP